MTEMVKANETVNEAATGYQGGGTKLTVIWETVVFDATETVTSATTDGAPDQPAIPSACSPVDVQQDSGDASPQPLDQMPTQEDPADGEDGTSLSVGGLPAELEQTAPAPATETPITHAPNLVNVLPSGKQTRRRRGKPYLAFGLRKNLKEWADLFGVRYATLYARLWRPATRGADVVILLEAILRGVIRSASEDKIDDPFGPTRYRVKGRYQTLSEWECEFGLPATCLRGVVWIPGTLLDPRERPVISPIYGISATKPPCVNSTPFRGWPRSG